jgi:hypothetical protein
VVIKHPITVVESTLAKPVNDKVLEVLGQFATENMDPLVGNGTDAEEYEDLEALDKQGHERKLSESLMKSLKETSKTHYAIHIGFMYGVSFANSKGELGEFELGPLSIIVRELRAK